jgi:hypothetical protein
MQWQMRVSNGVENSKEFCIPPVYGPEICINSKSSAFRDIFYLSFGQRSLTNHVHVNENKFQLYNTNLRIN